MNRAVAFAGLLSSIPLVSFAACSNSSGGNGPSGDASAETGAPSADGSSSEPDAASHPGSDAASHDSGSEAASSEQDGGNADTSPAEAGAAAADGAGDVQADALAEDAGDGGPCTAPLYWSTVTPVISSATSAPNQTGGMLVSGIYYLTAMTYYNATSACEETLSIMMTVDVADGGMSGTMTELSKATVGTSTVSSCVSGTFQTSGDTIVRSMNSASMTDLFTASSTEFTLVQGIDAGSAGSCEPTSMTFTLTF